MGRAWWWFRFKTYRVAWVVAIYIAPPDMRKYLIKMDEADFQRLKEWL